MCWQEQKWHIVCNTWFTAVFIRFKPRVPWTEISRSICLPSLVSITKPESVVATKTQVMNTSFGPDCKLLENLSSPPYSNSTNSLSTQYCFAVMAFILLLAFMILHSRSPPARCARYFSTQGSVFITRKLSTAPLQELWNKICHKRARKTKRRAR